MIIKMVEGSMLKLKKKTHLLHNHHPHTHHYHITNMKHHQRDVYHHNH